MDTIKVVVRVRPLNSRERAADQASSWTVAGNQIAPARSGQPYTFGQRLRPPHASPPPSFPC